MYAGATMAEPKLTTRQQQVLNVLKGSDQPLTPAQVWEKLGPSAMGVATVYRSINRLVESGLVKVVEIKDMPTLYESQGPREHHHHHFYCRECGEVFEIRQCAKNLKDLLPDGFTLEEHTITLYGRCAKCSAKAAAG